MGVNKRTGNNTKPDTLRPKFLRALRYRGLCSRVARECGVTRTHVHYVLTGKRSSQRIREALASEIHRIESESSAA